jgi:hypothetical protein
MRRTSYFRTIARTPVKAALRLQPRPRLLQRWETIPPAASLPDRPAPSPPEFKPVPSEASSAATQRLNAAPSVPSAPVAAPPPPRAPAPQPPVAPAKPEARPAAPEARHGKVAAPSPRAPAPPPLVAPTNRETRPTTPPPHRPASTPAPEARRGKDSEGWLVTEQFTMKELEPAREPLPPSAQAPPPEPAKSPEFGERITSTRIAQSPPPPTQLVVLQPPAPGGPAPPAPVGPAAEPQPAPHELHIGSIEVQVLPPAAPPSPPPVRRRAAQVSMGSLSRGYYSTFGIGQG